MEQSKINKLIVGGVIISIVVGLTALVLGIVILMKSNQGATVLQGVTETVTEEPTLMSRGFIGKPTSTTIRSEGAVKIIDLKGHVVDKEIPGYEPVNPSDTDARSIRIDGKTRITKITNIVGKAPLIEELVVNDLTTADTQWVYLARYEAIGKEVPMDTSAAFLEIYIPAKPAIKR